MFIFSWILLFYFHRIVPLIGCRQRLSFLNFFFEYHISLTFLYISLDFISIGLFLCWLNVDRDWGRTDWHPADASTTFTVSFNLVCIFFNLIIFPSIGSYFLDFVFILLNFVFILLNFVFILLNFVYISLNFVYILFNWHPADASTTFTVSFNSIELYLLQLANISLNFVFLFCSIDIQ